VSPLSRNLTMDACRWRHGEHRLLSKSSLPNPPPTRLISFLFLRQPGCRLLVGWTAPGPFFSSVPTPRPHLFSQPLGPDSPFQNVCLLPPTVVSYGSHFLPALALLVSFLFTSSPKSWLSSPPSLGFDIPAAPSLASAIFAPYLFALFYGTIPPLFFSLLVPERTFFQRLSFLFLFLDFASCFFSFPLS